MSLFGKGFFVFLSNRGFLQKVVIHENRHLEVSLPQCRHEVVSLWVYTPPIPHPVPAPFQDLLFSFLLRMLSIMNCIVILQDVCVICCLFCNPSRYVQNWMIWLVASNDCDMNDLFGSSSLKFQTRHWFVIVGMYFQVFSASLLVILLSFLLRITQKEMEMLLYPFWNASSRITVQTVSCACHEVLNFHAYTGMEERCLALSVFRFAVAPKEVVLALVPRDAIESGPQTGAVDPTPAPEIIVTRALDQRLVRKARLYNRCSKKIKKLIAGHCLFVSEKKCS